MDITNRWYTYLTTERKISPQIINFAKLDEENGMLKIPIFDKDGTHIFSKYRTAPWYATGGGPKYKYDKGGTVSLYGADHITDNMIITEGEIDCLSLLTCGYNACTSTGGALSFQQEWGELFKGKKVTLLFDNDEAGVRGAVKTGLCLEAYTFKWINTRMGKDVNEILQRYGVDTVKDIVENGDGISMQTPRLKCKKDYIEYRKVLKEMVKNRTSGNVGTLFIRSMILELSVRISAISPKKHVSNDFDGSELERARKYPIADILPVVHGKTNCIFHNDKTASLHIYKDNHAFCFGSCHRRYDAIDILMKKRNVDFKEALKQLQ